MSTAPEPLFLRIPAPPTASACAGRCGPSTVGRGENRIVLFDDGISGHHLRLDRDADGIVAD